MSWYYANEGRQSGPISDAEFDSQTLRGVIRDETLVWREGMKDWQPYRQVRAAGQSPAVAPPVAAGALSAATAPAAGQVTCVECRQPFSTDNAINYGTVWVCATCKPLFVQKLKEGAGAPLELPGEMHYAGFWIRFAARMIDMLIEGFVVGLPMLAIVFYSMGGLTPRAQPGVGQFVIQAVAQLVGLLFSVAYQTFFVGRYGATPGKLAVGIKVVTADGAKVTYMRAFGRAWVDRVSSLTCSIGYIIAAFDNEKRALHDHMCSTRVIYK